MSTSGEGVEEGKKGPLPIPGVSSVTQFSNEGTKRILAAIKACQGLPSPGPAWDLQKSYPEFNKAMRNARSKLTPMIINLLKHVNISSDEFRFGDVDEKFDFLVEANDDMLERIGRSLDEASGVLKKTEAVTIVNQGVAASALRPPGMWGKRKLEAANAGPLPETEVKDREEMSNRQIKKAIFKRTVKEKPQAKFKTPVDNSPSPFIPKLKEKPNSIKPLSILPEYNSRNEEFFGHPYYVELNRWEPQDSMMVKVTPQKPKALEETQLVEVNTVRDLEQLLKDLYPVTELAVDLEHHSYRSFLGFTCLMQISTRQKDYIIDALALRDHLYHLNEIFTHPKIVKVFHGSSSDVEWLQKDFGLYIVNMFDTQIAAKVLGLQQLGLQALLDKYCGVSQNKAFQLADWRLRPLPKEMIHYARQDTHSLLYIYDMLRNELMDAGNEHNNLLRTVYEQSRMLCLKRFEKPLNNPKLALRKMRRSLNNRQVYAFTELYKWRDELAREKDESIMYVLPTHMLLMIAEQLPKEMTGILACCDPVPPFLHGSLGTLHKIITAARELPLQEHSQQEKSEKREKLKDWVILMNSVHDVDEQEITKISDISEDHDEIQEDYTTLQHFNELPTEWPLPLKVDTDRSSNVISSKCSLTFNAKVRAARKMAPKKKISEEEHNMDGITTPFERYELSKEILEMLGDPKKKEALNMENPVVKAVYETVFLDPNEIERPVEQQGPYQLEKVLAEGEFIPFNPMVNEAQAKKRKAKRKADDWDEPTPTPDAAQVPPVEQFKMGLPVDLEEGEQIDQDDVDLPNSSAHLQDFMSVSQQQSSAQQSNNKKKKKKGKGKGLMNKIKNIGKKSKGKGKDESSTPDHNNSRHKQNNDSPSNSRKANGNGSKKSPRHEEGRGNKKNSKGKNKFFNFDRRSSAGRSMTFK